MDIEDIEDIPQKPDFARANGAPMIVDREGKRQRFGRPSNYAKPLDDESALTNWRIDTAAFGVAKDRALQARYAACDRDDRPTVKILREAAIQAGRGSEAADIGTALHAMTDRWEQEPTFDPGEPYRSSLEAYSAEMERLGLETVLFEFTTVNMEYRTAGTADRLYRLTRPLILPTGEYLPEGTLVIGDTKTGKTLEYSMGAYSTQMALYAMGERYDVVDDVFIETPEINQDWAIIMFMPSDSNTCTALWVDLNVGNEGAYLAMLVKEWRRKWRSGERQLWSIPDPQDQAEALIIEFGATWLDAEEDDTWAETMVPWCQSRIDAVGKNADARKYLATWWPEGVPTPKKGLHSIDDIEKVLDLLDLTEAEFGLTFPPGDPRSVPGAHSSDTRCSNRPGLSAEKEVTS